MHLFKYAFRNISRTKGRSILIGIIVLIIAFSLCIGLCIRQSVETSKKEALAELEITAQISPNREKAMDEMKGGNFEDMEEFDPSEMMGDSLSLDEMRIYAEADSVQSFYFSMNASFNGGEGLEPYSTSSSDSEESSSTGFGGFGGMGGMQMNSSDFTVEGYSSDEAMTQFVEGTSTIEEGKVFEEGTSDMVCIISDELAAYNSLSVGDSITLASTEDEEETFSLEIVGIYNNSQASAQAGNMMGQGRGGFGGFNDPANSIYTSYETLNAIVESSETVTGMLSGTYVLGSVEAYEAFQSEVEALGLSDEYTVSSNDISAYQQSAQPLDNFAKMAGYFLVVIVLIGAIILVVLNIFATRERKYEIGVLTAIGMKKEKVAGIFMAEILMITLIATVLGGSIGAAVSVPVADVLLEAQMESQQSNAMDRNESFGREFNMPPSGAGGGGEMPDVPEQPDGEEGFMGGFGGPIGSYVTDISASVNLTVLLQMLGISIMMAVISGMVSVISIMRYEPLQILSNRD